MADSRPKIRCCDRSPRARPLSLGLLSSQHGGLVAGAKKGNGKDGGGNKGGGGGGKKNNGGKGGNNNKKKDDSNTGPNLAATATTGAAADAVFNDAFFSNVIEGSSSVTLDSSNAPTTIPSLPAPPPLPTVDPSKPLTLEDKMKLATACLSSKDIQPIVTPVDMKAAVPVWNDLNTTLPLAVVQPSTTQEISDAISCLYSNGVRAVAYSGGCSLMGMSVLPTSVTVDLSFMKNVTLNQDSSLSVQGGATLGDIYSATYAQSKGTNSVVGAACPALGVGQMLGGGIGSLTRMFGLACDQLLSLTMVQYDGKILKVSPTDNQDLFWASCGGGGGNFGIVSDYVIKTVNVPPTLTSFDFSVTNNMVNFLMDVQDKIAVNADPLFSKLQLTFRNTSVDVRGLYLGTETGLAGALKDAGLAPFVEKQSAKSQSVNWLDFVLEQARSLNCTRARDAAGLADRKLTNFGEDVAMSSFYVVPSNLLTASAFEELLKWKASGKDTFVEVDVLGPKSKVAAVATPDTAYAFRPALLAVQYGTKWRNRKDDRKNEQLTSEMTTLSEKFLGNPVVPREINYLALQSPNLLGYYGSNLPRLISIKTKYDPQNYWQNPLSVPSNADGQFTVPDVAVVDVNGDGVIDSKDSTAGGGSTLTPGKVTAGAVGGVGTRWMVGLGAVLYHGVHAVLCPW